MNELDNNDILISLVGMSLKYSDQKLESHPDSETLAAFVDNPLPNNNVTLKAINEIKEHLNSCPDCYQQWFELKRQMLALQSSEQPWYAKLLSYKFGLTPLQFNLTSGAVAASLVFVLAKGLMLPSQQPIATFKLPAKHSSLDDYCKDCSIKDYDTYITELSNKLKQDCTAQTSKFSKDVNDEVQQLIKMHPEKDNAYLNDILLECKTTIPWQEE